MLKTRTNTELLCHYVIFDSDWQYPAATEKHAAKKVAELCSFSRDTIYFGFPWANLIDRLNCKDERSEALAIELEKCIQLLKGYTRVVTVCQHIYFFKYLYLFGDAGVTDIFWSHATERSNQELTLAGYSNFTIHPFPLLPVAFEKGAFSNTADKRFLFSFVGARASLGYRTESRNAIIDYLSSSPKAFIKGRDGWHYAKEVYKEQVKGIQDKATESADHQSPQTPKTKEFIDLMKDSAFSLCPSGTGPNSIRLWEALQTASIPVVLADGLLLPGEQELWKSACLIVPETHQEIKTIPELLQSCFDDKERYAKMIKACQQLAILYGPDYFVHDIALFFLQDHESKGEPSTIANKQTLYANQRLIERTIRTCDKLISEIEEYASDQNFDEAKLFIKIRRRDEFVRSRMALFRDPDGRFINIMNRLTVVKAKAGWFSSPNFPE